MLSDYKDTSGNTESEKNILTEIAAAEAATPAAGKPRNDKTPPQAAEAK